MKKPWSVCLRTICLLAAVLALCLSAVSAGAEIYVGQEPPADWADRETLTLTAFATVSNDATLLEVGGRSMLIDGGFKGWRYKMAKALAAMGYEGHVDVLFNTHPHDDHLGAVAFMVKDGLRADEFISTFPKACSEPIQKTAVKYLDEAGIPYRQLRNGEEMDFGGAKLVFWYYPDGKDPNALSCMLHITFGNSTALLAADTTSTSHKWFHANLGPEVMRADILKYPHHGYTAVNGTFLDDVSPRFCYVTHRVLSTAKVNAQLRKRGIPYLHTSVGRVVMVTDGTDWYITQYKDQF